MVKLIWLYKNVYTKKNNKELFEKITAGDTKYVQHIVSKKSDVPHRYHNMVGEIIALFFCTPGKLVRMFPRPAGDADDVNLSGLSVDANTATHALVWPVLAKSEQAVFFFVSEMMQPNL